MGVQAPRVAGRTLPHTPPPLSAVVPEMEKPARHLASPPGDARGRARPRRGGPPPARARLPAPAAAASTRWPAAGRTPASYTFGPLSTCSTLATPRAGRRGSGRWTPDAVERNPAEPRPCCWSRRSATATTAVPRLILSLWEAHAEPRPRRTPPHEDEDLLAYITARWVRARGAGARSGGSLEPSRRSAQQRPCSAQALTLSASVDGTSASSTSTTTAGPRAVAGGVRRGAGRRACLRPSRSPRSCPAPRPPRRIPAAARDAVRRPCRARRGSRSRVGLPQPRLARVLARRLSRQQRQAMNKAVERLLQLETVNGRRARDRRLSRPRRPGYAERARDAARGAREALRAVRGERNRDPASSRARWRRWAPRPHRKITEAAAASLTSAACAAASAGLETPGPRQHAAAPRRRRGGARRGRPGRRGRQDRRAGFERAGRRARSRPAERRRPPAATGCCSPPVEDLSGCGARAAARRCRA